MFNYDADDMLRPGKLPSEEPIEVPPFTVFDEPLQCLMFSSSWGPIIARALEPYLYYDAWKGTKSDIQRAHQGIQELIGRLNGMDCGPIDDNESCYDLALYAPNVDWEPMNPYRNPDELPTGWNFPPWHIAPGGLELGGIQPGDVYTHFLDYQSTFPPFLPVSGFPRVQIYVDGSGELDVTLVRIPQGGLAAIFVDGVLVDSVETYTVGLGSFLDLSNWTAIMGLAIEEQWFEEVTVQIPVSGAGIHQIGIEFRPLFSTVSVFGFGGGIRSFQWCGAAIPAEINGMISDMRITDCGLEMFKDGMWQAIPGARSLPLDLSCQLEGHNLQLRPETNQPGLVLVAEANKPGQNYLQANNADGEIFSLTHPGAMQVVNRQGVNSAANLVQRYSMRHNNALNSFGSIISWEASTAANGPVRGVADLATSWFLATDNVRVGRQRYFMSGVGGQAVLMEFRRGATSQIGFFGATPVNQPSVTGLTVDSALASSIAALQNLGLITSSVALPASAPIVQLRQQDCHLQYSIDGDLWDDVPGAEYLPLSAESGCNAVVLQNPGYLIVQRVGGSTEAANPVLRLQTMQGGAGSSIPQQVIFEGETDATMKPIASLETRFLAEGASAHRGALDINLYDASGTRRVMSSSAVVDKPAVGFLGATPAIRHHIVIDNNEPDNMLGDLLIAMEAFGFINLTPCAPEIGDWAIVWNLEQLTGLNASCGSYNLDGYGPELNCPDPGDLTLALTSAWGGTSNEFTVVLIRATFENAFINNAIEGIQWTITKNPGIGSLVLEGDTYAVEGTTNFTIEWEGSEDMNEFGVEAHCQDVDFDFRLTSIRVEGIGVRPPLNQGDGCLD